MNRPGIDVGDCFEASIEAAVEAAKACLRSLVCHGKPIGRGEHNKGIRYWHAWAEAKFPDGWYVLEFSMGKRMKIHRAVYYQLGQLQGEIIDKYSLLDVAMMIHRHDHIGPWQRYEEAQP